MTARATFRQDDVTRAVRGVEAAKLRVAQVRCMPDGEIVIVTSNGAPAESADANPWDSDNGETHPA